MDPREPGWWEARAEGALAFDLETYLMEEGILAPRIVCGSEASAGGDGTIAGRLLWPRSRAVARFREALEAATCLVLANGSYDLACLAVADPSLLPPIFRLFDEGRVYDVLAAQALDAVAGGHLGVDPETGRPMRGRYSLAAVVKQTLGRDDAKARDFWRKRYALLERVPVERWPADAKQYPVDDSCNTLEAMRAQVFGGGAGVVPGPHRNLCRMADEAEAAWDLHLGAVWGLRVDPARYAWMERWAAAEVAKHSARMLELGLYQKDPKTGELKKDAREVKRRVVRAYTDGVPGPCPNSKCRGGKELGQRGNPVFCKTCDGTGLDISQAPPTKGGGVCADRDKLVESGDEDLIECGDNLAERVLGTYLPFLKRGLDRPLTLRPNAIVSTLRTSYEGLIQLMPREGGIRPCFRARGAWCGSPLEYVYCSVDYGALELCTLAQVYLWLFGRSPMADAINLSGDPGYLHTALAARMRGVSPEEMQAALDGLHGPEAKAAAAMFRFAAKALNFGLPGGMGAAKLVLSKRSAANGTTTGPDGRVYPGVRFCLLVPDPATGRTREVCGEERVTQWRGRACPPVCKACVSLVDRELKPAWVDMWEMGRYFDWVSDRIDCPMPELPFWTTDATRGGLDYPNACNHSFQSLAAIGAKRALRRLTRECYLEGLGSSLLGSRPAFFAHDEVVSELLRDRAHEAAHRKSSIMVEEMRVVVPDVAVRAEPALMDYWLKEAEPCYLEADGSHGKGCKKPGPGKTLVAWDRHHQAKFKFEGL